VIVVYLVNCYRNLTLLIKDIKITKSFESDPIDLNGSMGKVINSEFERFGRSGTGKRALTPLAEGL